MAALGLVLIVPGLQGSGDVDPGMQEVPAGQARQASSAFAPVTFELVPAGHDAGVGLPTIQYDPGGHSSGVTVAFPQNAPGGQRPEH